MHGLSGGPTSLLVIPMPTPSTTRPASASATARFRRIHRGCSGHHRTLMYAIGLLQARSKGRSQPPLRVTRLRTSKSDDDRNSPGVYDGTWLLRWRKPDVLSMEWA